MALLPYNEKRLTADRNDQDIYVIPTSACDAPGGCTPRRVARLMGSENSLAWSPDSKVLAYLSRSARFTQLNLFVVEVATGGTKNLTARLAIRARLVLLATGWLDPDDRLDRRQLSDVLRLRLQPAK